MGAVYFDHNATTPLDAGVRDAMLPWMGERWGNASSIHSFGRDAREAVETARDAVAGLLDAPPSGIVFTASGTEANNMVIDAVARAAGFRGHVVLSSIEHPSIHGMVARLEESGMTATRVDPDENGRVDADRFVAEIADDTVLACLMLANNEVGAFQPVAEVASACRRRGVPVLCDAVQVVGKGRVSAEALAVDYLVLGAHKFYGPLGAAALWAKEGAALAPYLVGGSQERRLRAGTVNVPAIVGLGAAAELAAARGEEWAGHCRRLRDRFEAGLAAIGDAVVHGARVERLPNTSHVAFLGTEGEALMIRLDLAGFAVSTGSACSSGAVQASRTMKAMRVPFDEAVASLRVSFGKGNDETDVDRFLEALSTETATLRALTSPAAR